MCGCELSDVIFVIAIFALQTIMLLPPDILSDRLSKGPLEPADRGSEFTSFEAADLDVKFLLALLSEKNKVMSNACIPRFSICGYRRPFDVCFESPHTRCRHRPGRVLRIRSGVVLTHARSKPRFWVPKDMRRELDECRRRGKRYAVCNFGLHGEEDLTIGHANALVFDTRDKLIERYEPAGRHKNHAAIDRAIEDCMRHELPGWSYAGTRHATPARGPQEIADSFSGMCVTFSLLYVLTRLNNEHLSAKQVHDLLVAQGADQIRRTALRLNAAIADKLKRIRRGSLGSSHRGRQGRPRSNCRRDRPDRRAKKK